MPKIGNARYYWASVLSGCGWAVVAYVLAVEPLGPIVLGGLVASPLIGLLAGFIYRPVYKLKGLGQCLASLLSLYLAVALFGLAVGIYDLLWRSHLARIPSAVILQGPYGTLLGVTFTFYFLPLWLLAYFNHRLLGAGIIKHPILR